MKVMFIASDNYSASGAFRSMVQLIVCLRRKGIEAIVVLPNRGSGTKLLIDNKIKFYFVKSCNWCRLITENRNLINKCKTRIRKLINVFSVKCISKIVLKEKCDLIHINTTYSYVGAIVGHRHQIPVVWHLREFLEEDQNAEIIDKRKGYELINKSNYIIAISSSVFNKYKNIFDNTKMKVIYNGISDEYYKPNKQIFMDDEIKIVIVGTLSEKKGQLDAIRALEVLKKKTNMKYKLKIIGIGNQEYCSILKEEIKIHKLENEVEFLGKKDNVSEFFEWADISLTCSKAEAFGRVTIEGMLSGCLMIGNNTAGTSELIEEKITGLTYENNDYLELAEKINYACTNKEFARKIANSGRENALNNFTAEKNAEEIIKVYEDIFKKQSV